MTRKPKILIVEDNQHTNYILKFAFSQHGYEVITCFDGDKALEEAKKEKPEVVILDIMLPGITGVDVFKELKQDPLFKNTVFVFLSAITQDTDVDGTYFTDKIGADLFFPKPFKLKELVESINNLLSKRGVI
jgi:two-component system, OmpR family, alkaline phosphatase synthesis response regulator PhoP